MLRLIKKALKIGEVSELPGRDPSANTSRQHYSIINRFVYPLLVILLVVGMVLSGFNIQVVRQPNQNQSTNDIPTLRIGFANGVYAAPVLDYTINGNADDEFQAAINALPATGGRIEAMAGTYTFAATVSRAIPGVIIEGQGVSTVFNYNASTALFSAGSQSGWQFRDFKTDAGGITVSSATNWIMTNVTIGSNYYALYSDRTQGATFPATPYTGEQFLLNTTGRKVLYQYDGSAWQPIRGYGSITVYVDKTDGTDDLVHGTGVDANAFKSIQYAINSIPPIHDPTTIYINNESYTENLCFDPNFYLNCRNDGIYMIGTLGTSTNKTATGGTIGSGATVATITGTFSANAYNQKIVKFTSGSNNGLYRIIGLTSTTNLYLIGAPLNAAPQNNDTYTIYDFGTTITVSGTAGFALSRTSLWMKYIKVSSSATFAIALWQGSYLVTDVCNIVHTGNTGFWISNNSFTMQNQTLVNSNSATGIRGYNVDDNSGVELNGCKLIQDSKTAGSWGLSVDGGFIYGLSSCEVSGYVDGVRLDNNSGGRIYNSGVNTFIHGCDLGIAALNASQFNTGSVCTYGKLVDNSTTDANAFADEYEKSASSFIDAEVL